eukprot:4271000-Pyramimonas_sp.AAC.1
MSYIFTCRAVRVVLTTSFALHVGGWLLTDMPPPRVVVIVQHLRPQAGQWCEKQGYIPAP